MNKSIKCLFRKATRREKFNELGMVTFFQEILLRIGNTKYF